MEARSPRRSIFAVWHWPWWAWALAVAILAYANSPPFAAQLWIRFDGNPEHFAIGRKAVYPAILIQRHVPGVAVIFQWEFDSMSRLFGRPAERVLFPTAEEMRYIEEQHQLPPRLRGF